jgi:hypothetical protein
LRVGPQGGGDQVKKGLRHLLAVDHLPALEKTVAGVLGIGVVEIHDLDDGRVTPLLPDKVVVIELAVPFIHGDAGQFKEAIRPLATKIDLVYRFRFYPGRKGRQRFEVSAFGHPVMVTVDKISDINPLRNLVETGSFDPGDLLKSSSPADGDHVRRPSGGEVKPRPHLNHPLADKGWLARHGLGQQAFGEDQPQAGHFVAV